MLRLLHAADFHLDSAFGGLDSRKAMIMREAQRKQLERIAALSEGCDLVLLAGDLFDSARSYGETEKALGSFFEALRIPVFLSPGNHDYYTDYGIYGKLRFPSNVHVFKTAVPECVRMEALGVSVYGAGFRSAASGPVLDGFRAEEDGDIRLMVLHGEVCGGGSSYNPITKEQIAASNLNYLALGHVHRFSGLQREGKTVWAYPGCTMGRGFDETGEKGIILAEVGEEDCRVCFVPLSAHRYEKREVDISGSNAPEKTIAEVMPDDSETCILRIVLHGETDGELNLPLLRSRLEDECWQLELVDKTTAGAGLWRIGEENTLKGAFVRRMKERYDRAENPEEGETVLMALRMGLAALEHREAFG